MEDIVGLSMEDVLKTFSMFLDGAGKNIVFELFDSPNIFYTKTMYFLPVGNREIDCNFSRTQRLLACRDNTYFYNQDSYGLLPDDFKGDGIGPEIVTEAQKVLDKVAEKFGHKFVYTDILMGGCSIDKYGVPLTDEAVEIAKNSDAVLLGSIGGNTSTSPWYLSSVSLFTMYRT